MKIVLCCIEAPGIILVWLCFVSSFAPSRILLVSVRQPNFHTKHGCSNLAEAKFWHISLTSVKRTCVSSDTARRVFGARVEKGPRSSLWNSDSSSDFEKTRTEGSEAHWREEQHFCDLLVVQVEKRIRQRGLCLEVVSRFRGVVSGAATGVGH